MALFRRKEKTTIAELEDYYANQKTRRSATAWLMALLSLLITAAVILLLFFAGRWAFNAIFGEDDNSQPETTTQTENDVNLPTFDTDSDSSDQGLSFTEGTSNNPDDLIIVQGSGQDSSTQSDGTVSDEAASTTESNADRIAGNNDQTDNSTSNGQSSTSDTAVGGESGGSVAGSATTTPNTGAGETTLLILITVAVLGYLASRRHQLKQ